MTIYALSSGPGLSGIAVIRLSGPNSKEVIEKLTKEKAPKPRHASVKKIYKLKDDKKWEELEFFKSDYIASKDVNAWLGLYRVL